MARNDFLINLVKAGVSGDKQTIRSVVETMIAEEKKKQHLVLVDRLACAMHSNGIGLNRTQHIPNEKRKRGVSSFLK